MSSSLSIENSVSHESRLPYEPDSEVSPSQKNKKKKKKQQSKAMKYKTDSRSGAKPPLDTVSPSQKKSTGAEPKEEPKEPLEDMSGAKPPLDTVSPSQKKPTGAEPKEESEEPLEYIYGEKFNLGNDSRPLEKTKAMECKVVPEDFISRSEGKLPLDKVSPSRKKSNTTKPKKNLENDVFRSGEKVPKLKPDEYLDYFPQHYVTGLNGVKLYTEVIRPTKKKKPKATKKKDNKRLDEKREDLEDRFFREYEETEEASLLFARAALSYLRERGDNLELVKPGLYEVGEVTRGCRAHFNFKAKKEDDPSAPVEMYFGQLCCYGESNIVVECCVSLGESDSLPYDPENRGCEYCTNLVHHPLGGCKGIVWGLLTYSRKTDSYIIA